MNQHADLFSGLLSQTLCYPCIFALTFEKHANEDSQYVTPVFFHDPKLPSSSYLRFTLPSSSLFTLPETEANQGPQCYFAAVAGDAPTFECWPTQESYHLHEYILALWGMPLGEMLDLEKMSELAKKNKKWTFFFCSSPANVPNGVSSHVNGTAIF